MPKNTYNASLGWDNRVLRAALKGPNKETLARRSNEASNLLEPISVGRLRRWQYLVVRLHCLRYCRLAIDLTR